MVITESCKCGHEIEVKTELVNDFHIYCPYCGSILMLCDECQHAVCEDGEPRICDWDEKTNTCQFSPSLPCPFPFLPSPVQ